MTREEYEQIRQKQVRRLQKYCEDHVKLGDIVAERYHAEWMEDCDRYIASECMKLAEKGVAQVQHQAIYKLAADYFNDELHGVWDRDQDEEKEETESKDGKESGTEMTETTEDKIRKIGRKYAKKEKKSPKEPKKAEKLELSNDAEFVGDKGADPEELAKAAPKDENQLDLFAGA